MTDICADESALACARLQEGRSPLVVASHNGASLLASSRVVQALVARELPRCGGLLLRDFAVEGVAEFRAFAASFGDPLLSYEFGSTPRSRVSEGVYSSTEYPAHQSIPLHSEQSYCREWPMRIWFHSVEVAPEGGETPIADCREIYHRVDARIRERLSQRGIMYVRNYGGGLDVPWQQVFNTADPKVVEAYCRRNEIAWEWKPDGELRTRQVCQAVARHPGTGEVVWFNQAHLFHVSALAPEVRDALLEVVEPEDLPRNVYYGDGRPIETQLLDEIRGVLSDLAITFPWQAGDVLMLDNMLMAHARAPYRGNRRVVVAMASPQRADAVP